jgi:hypothetical protein
VLGGEGVERQQLLFILFDLVGRLRPLGLVLLDEAVSSAFSARSRSSASRTSFRAARAAGWGWAVTPVIQILRWPSSMKNST